MGSPSSKRVALVVPAVVLTVAALVLRWPAISTDGLLFDDAWVAIGGTKASLGELLTVSTMHPGFTASLMGWSAVTPADTTWTTMPVYLVGAATPAITFLLFRRLRIAWWAALVAGTLVLVAPTHVVYSGRVKPYMLETVAILLLAAMLGRIARRRWSPSTAALWVGAACVFATINAFAFTAIAVAAVVLLLHPEGDWPVRAVATASQAIVQVLYLGAVQRSFAADDLEAGWGDVFDGYVELDRDPLDLIEEIGSHVSRVGQVVVEQRWVALGLVVIGVGGLAWRSWRGPYKVMARFLLALPAVAFVGSVVERLPFGTIEATPVYPGTRASLWLLPSVLAGVAFALDALDGALAKRGDVARWGGAAAVGAVVAAIAVAGIRHDASYPEPGTETAHALADDGSPGDDLVLVLDSGRWNFAAVPEVGVDIDPQPDMIVGYEPLFTDEGTFLAGFAADWEGSAAQERLHGGDVDRVVFVNFYAGIYDDVVPVVEAELDDLGFALTDARQIGPTSVDVWERSAG